jgi:serine/threonine-protein phosphatase PP1 catalytic subunit
MPQTIIELLNKGTQANSEDNFRRGNLIQLPTEGDLIITGDLHGHCRNFERTVAFADLASHPKRHIVFQEIIHGGPEDSEGGCMSYQLLFQIVRYKLSFPDQVHVIMGNHDTAFINNSEVMKDGKEMNRSMRGAIKREYKKDAAKITFAIKQFLFSQPLAVRCENRVWLSHSLPSDRLVDKFDPEIFNRELKVNDVVKPGSAYLLTWGRKMSQELLDKMAEIFDIDVFVLGHQPQEKGWCQAGKNLIIIASNHNHGCLLPIDLTQSYTVEQLVEALVPMASLP